MIGVSVFVCAEFNLKSPSTHKMRMDIYFRDSNSGGRKKELKKREKLNRERK